MTTDFNKTDELIDAYLQGELDQTEMTELYSHISKNPSLVKRIKEQRLINNCLSDNKLDKEINLIKQYPTIGAQDTLATKTAEFRQLQTVYQNLNRKLDEQYAPKALNAARTFHYLKHALYAAAAIIVLLISGFVIKNLIFTNNNPQNLVADETQIEKTEQTQTEQAPEIIATNKVEDKTHNATQQKTSNIHAKQENKIAESPIKRIINEYLNKYKDNSDLTLLAYAEAQDVKLPDNYIEDTTWERVAKSDFRSIGLAIVYPQDIQIIEGELNFEWRSTVDAVTVIVLDNKRNELWKQLVVDTKKIKCNLDLEPGTYYLKMTANLNGESTSDLTQFFIVE